MDGNGNLESAKEQGDDREMAHLAEGLRRFAYQNGMAAGDTNAFFNRLRERAALPGPDEDVELMLHRMAASELAKRTELHNDGALIGFQEDRESHLALQSLPLQERMITILYLVNSHDLTFTAQALQTGEQEVLELAHSAKHKLAEKLSVKDQQELVQRLEFLEKSTKRIKLPDREEPIEESGGAAEPQKEQAPKVKKPAIWLVAASIALLAGVVGASFFFDNLRLPSESEASAGQLTQELADEMEQQYVETRENAKQRLGLEEGKFAEFAYVADADQEKDELFSRSNLQQHEDDAELFIQQMEELIWMIETPKGMGESLANSGHMPVEEMDRFMQLYFEKTNELQNFAEGILKNNEEQLPAASDHYGEPQLLIEELQGASAELEQLLAAWPEYGLRFRLADPDRRHLLTKDIEVLQRLPQFQTHPFAHMYLQLFTFHPYFDEQGWLVEPAHLIGAFDTMLYLLIDEPTESALKTELEVMYEQTFWQITKGSENELYAAGAVKPEIRKLWKTLASYDPLAAILLPVIDEMEDSGWRKSASLENLEYGDSLDMLKMEQQGELSSTLPNGDFPLESELVDLADFDYDRVKELYARFKKSYDIDVLAGVQPLDVYLLYFYANRLEDPDVMYHLLADSDFKPSLEQYTSKWEPLPELTENALWVEIQQEATQRIYKKLMIQPMVAYEEQDNGFHRSNPLQPALVTEQDHIWLVQYEQQETSQGPDPELQQKGMEAYRSLDDKEKLPKDTSPLVVAYALLHAVDEENTAVANTLLGDGAEEREVEFWRNFASSHQAAGFDNLKAMSFTATDLNIENEVEGSLEILYETEETDQWYEYLQMDLTPEGWRFELYSNY
ncbi:MAG: hypothetical protein ACQEV0_12160 [Bacillota bacterium]